MCAVTRRRHTHRSVVARRLLSRRTIVNPNGRGAHLIGKVKTRKQTLAAHYSLGGNASLSQLRFTLPIFGTTNPALETEKSFRGDSNNSQVAKREWFTN